MPTHHLTHAQAYIVAIAPLLIGGVGLYLLAAIAWAWVQIMAEQK